MSKKWPRAIVIDPCWTFFCSQKLRKKILATFVFNRTAKRATLDVLRPVLEEPIISRKANVAWPPRSCYLTPLDYWLWSAFKDKCYVDKPETFDTLNENIRKAIGEIQLHTIDNVLKSWTDGVSYCLCKLRQPLERRYFPLLTERILLWNKKKKFKKILSSFCKLKKRYLADPLSDVRLRVKP